MKKPHFKKVVIAGVGLMGGSLGLALKHAKLADQVVGLARREQTIREAKQIGCIDAGTLSVSEAVMDADLIVLCTPVRSTPVMLEQMLPYLAPGCLITDVGSTKAELMQQIQSLQAKAGKMAKHISWYFVGSHPMAGSEKPGVLASSVDLYQAALCLVVRTPVTQVRALERIKAMWRAVGCQRVEVVSPQAHDRLTAMASHVPHALAVCLVNQMADWNQKDARTSQVAATGFRDTTRIAAGLPGMWLDILLSNRKEVGRALGQLQNKITRLRRLLDKAQASALLTELERASAVRLGMEKGKHVQQKNRTY